MKYIYGIVIAVIIVGSSAFLMTWSDEASLQITYEAPSNRDLTDQTYDVIVVGGEPEGVAAAVAAARNGALTLLVEKRSGLGGLMTFGKLNYIDMVYGIDGEEAVGGIFKEWHNLVGGDVAFDIERGKDAFMHLVLNETPNLTLAIDTQIKDAILADDQKTVTGVVAERDGETIELKGKRIIDATPDADYAVMAGAPYFYGGEDINLEDQKMAVTLMMHFKNVDWSGIRQAARDDIFGGAETTHSVAWGFKDLAYEYSPVEDNTRLRGLNIVRTTEDDGSEGVIINALQIFDVDGTNQKHIDQAIEKGKRETEHIIGFLRKNLPGFEQADVASYPSELYIRETRHVKSEYMLQMSDVWMHRDFWDGIAYGGYPVDVQATDVSNYGYVLSAPEQYAIPFRSMVPLEVENLLVVSRSAGYSSLAAGSARIIPTGMAVAEAGGTAAQLSVERDLTFRQLSESRSDVEDLRGILRDQGAKVDPFSIDYPYKGEWYDEAIQFLIDYGLIVGGYANDLKVDEDLNRMHFINLISNGLKRSNEEAYEEYGEVVREPVATDRSYGDGVFTRDGLAEYLISVFEEGESVDQPWNQLLESGLIDGDIYERFPEDDVLQRKDGYYIAAHVLWQYAK